MDHMERITSVGKVSGLKRSWSAEEVRRVVTGSKDGQDSKMREKRHGIPAAYGKSWR